MSWKAHRAMFWLLRSNITIMNTHEKFNVLQRVWAAKTVKLFWAEYRVDKNTASTIEMAIACLITSCTVVSFHYSLLKIHTFKWKDSSFQYSRNPHIRHQYNRLLRITDLVNREFASLKSVVNYGTLKIVRYAALATAWRLNLDQHDNLTTLDTIAIYFFSQHKRCRSMQAAAGGFESWLRQTTWRRLRQYLGLYLH